MADNEKSLNELADRLAKAHGASLVSLLLYGSGAIGDANEKFSDLNVLCVLDEITPSALGRSESVFEWWRAEGHPAPVLLSEDEVRHATDCFAIEFHDIQARSRLLAGRDVVSGLVIDYTFYRSRVEYELRAKLLRLRQKAAGMLSKGDMLLRLMADSLSTFTALTRHAVRLDGGETYWKKREIIAAASARFGFDGQPFYTLLDLREGTGKPKAADAGAILEAYLKQIQIIVDAVDRLER